VSVLVLRLAQKLGITEGQVYTVTIGLVVGLAAAIAGIPPTMVDRIAAPASNRRPAPVAASAPAASGGAAAPMAAPAGPSFPDGGGLSLPVDSSGGFPAPASGLFGGDGGLFGDGTESTNPEPSLEEPIGTTDVFAAVPAPGAPEGIAVTDDGRVFVATNNGGGRGEGGPPKVLRFSGIGTVEAEATLTAVEPGYGVRGLALPRDEAGGNVVYAVTARPSAVLRVDLASGAVATYATIPNLPSCAATALVPPCETSAVDAEPEPRAAAFGADGALYVADRGQAVIWRVAPGGGAVAVFHQALEYVSANGLSGIAFDAPGRLVLTVAESLSMPGSGAVHRLPIDATGKPGTLEKVATTAPTERPVGITAGASGRLYVALSGVGRVVVLDEEGTELHRFPGAADAAYDTPVGVALRGQDLLVTVQAPTRPIAGQVVRIAVQDRPATP
jgi:sugar lactone lactonase YvrE